MSAGATSADYVAKVRAGRRPSPEEALAFLRAFHAAHPGITAKAVTRYRTSEGQTSYELFADRIARDARKENAPARGVLDLACGDGVLCVEIRRRTGDACALVGVDTSVEDLTLAAARVGSTRTRFLCEPAQRMSLAPASVDVVACHFALMLMNDAPAVVREIARVLAPGGAFHALVPSRSSAARFTPKFEALVSEVLARDVPAYPDLGLGDRALSTQDGISSLFDARAGFGEVTFEHVPLRVDDTPAQSLELVEGLYWFDMLTPESQARLRTEGRTILDLACDGAGRVPGAFDLLLVRAPRLERITAS